MTNLFLDKEVIKDTLESKERIQKILDRAKRRIVQKMVLKRRFNFEAAHFLPKYKGLCAATHGHGFKFDVAIEGKINPETGMIMDFKELDFLVKDSVLYMFDHTLLNDRIGNPTAEYIASMLGNLINNLLPKDIKIKWLELWETEKSSVIWYPDKEV